MTLPLETINGNQYQPVEYTEPLDCTVRCAFSCANGTTDACDDKKCCEFERDDGLSVYFIEIGDTNEQEQ